MISNPAYSLFLRMLEAGLVKSDHDLESILRLQKQNLKTNITPQEKSSQGFVTMQFNLPMLQGFHRLSPSIVVRNNGEVVAYALVVPLAGRELYPSLESMFVNFSHIQWKGKSLYDYTFYVMGQVCIAKDWRGKGLFEMLYNTHRDLLSKDYDFVVTEISTSNHRSMRAHERIGFQNIFRPRDESDDWVVFLWDWQ